MVVDEFFCQQWYMYSDVMDVYTSIYVPGDVHAVEEIYVTREYTTLIWQTSV